MLLKTPVNFSLFSVIEHLPVELRDRFYEIREMDLGVQNKVDQIVTREKIFFANCSRKLKPAEREEEYEKIKNEYETQLSTLKW